MSVALILLRSVEAKTRGLKTKHYETIKVCVKCITKTAAQEEDCLGYKNRITEGLPPLKYILFEMQIDFASTMFDITINRWWQVVIQ